jgi:hypothetical protein
LLTVNHPLLTCLGVQTRRVPILEEVVQASAVREDIRAVDDAKAPGPGAIECGAFCKRWVGVSRLTREWREGVRVALEVSRFMLDQSHEDVVGM